MAGNRNKSELTDFDTQQEQFMDLAQQAQRETITRNMRIGEQAGIATKNVELAITALQEQLIPARDNDHKVTIDILRVLIDCREKLLQSFETQIEQFNQTLLH